MIAEFLYPISSRFEKLDELNLNMKSWTGGNMEITGFSIQHIVTMF